MQKTPRYTVKKYILLSVTSATVGLVIAAILISLIGLPTQGILVVVLFSFPFILYACLRGFYKGLVDHYGFKEPNLNNKKDFEK